MTDARAARALAGASAAVITVSDRRSSGQAEDTAGPAVADALHTAGAAVEAWVVPDGLESVTTAIEQALSSGARIVLTAGGTGVHPRDVTPEATRPFLDRELPGIPELLRAARTPSVATAALTRGLAGVTAGHGAAIIVNLPGSERGAREGIDTLLPVLSHVLSQLDGGDH